MYNRREFMKLTTVSAAALAVLRGVIAGENTNKPHIVLFLSDDHGWADSGAYGDICVKTPNMDNLAKESMLFNHAYAAAPLCSPSRAVIASGLMPMRNGNHLQGGKKKQVPKYKSMVSYMKDLGYYTACVGKQSKRTPYDFKGSLGTYGATTDEHRKELVSFISSYDKDQPLYLEVCTYQPHTPWAKNREYDPAKIPMPENLVDTPETRQDRADYYTDITAMDQILGEVLSAFKTNGMDRNMLFVYTSDQGSNWPFAKWCVYDGGLRVPMLVRWPGMVKEGSRTDAMVGLVDLLPTFIEAAGGTAPQNIDGRSFTGVLTGKRTKHRDVVFGSHSGSTNGPPEVHNLIPMRTVRTPTHRYIMNLGQERHFTNHITGSKPGEKHYLAFWPSWVEKAKTDRRAREIVQRYQYRPEEELYDLRKDPLEMNNIADDPEQAELLDSLRKQLASWCKAQDDTIALKYLPGIMHSVLSNPARQ
jgi:arylsulfatase A-like enzyme